jgi:hypothetical protein
VALRRRCADQGDLSLTAGAMVDGRFRLAKDEEDLNEPPSSPVRRSFSSVLVVLTGVDDVSMFCMRRSIT